MTQIVETANCKIYNLSAGKSLPEWLTDRKKRSLQKDDINVRKRIELIQDFEMPGVSSCIQVSRDGQYILATGVYKPRLRCYDVNNLSMKFERCFDYETVNFEILSEDYSKLVLLQCNRYVEFHVQSGRHFRTRIPKEGRDLVYHYPSCDLFLVGASNEIYRLNLEQGKFLNSFITESVELNVCSINPVHQLLVCGSVEGRIEAWDPRSRHRVGILDCALDAVTPGNEITGFPSITAVSFKDGMNMAVGVATGQVMLYDIRSNKPYLIKDHLYGLPIKSIRFQPESEMVISMDKKIIKLWNENTGKTFTSIEPGVDLNDLCIVPNTGMLLAANEDKKMLIYYIPALGVAPKWCAFLDNLTEELEESRTDLTYDDYKFVTKKDLEELGLSSLIGSNLLRAYMHGYFMDIRLYHKAKTIVQPHAYEEYRRKKIQEKIEEHRSNRVKIQPRYPKVNKDLAIKLMESQASSGNAQKAKKESSLLEDERFKSLFENPDFQVDETSEDFLLLHPLVKKIDKDRIKKQKQFMEQFDKVEEEKEGMPSSEEESMESSSDDDHAWTVEVKKQHRLLKQERKLRRQQEDREAQLEPSFYELKLGETDMSLHRPRENDNKKLSFDERLVKEREMGNSTSIASGPEHGSRQMTFTLQKVQKQRQRLKEANEHHKERKQVTRSAKMLETKSKKRFR